MKKLVISTLAALAVAASASAAYISASVGYLVDAEEAVFALRGGIPFKATETEKLGALEHNAELEVGYFSETPDELGNRVKFEYVPVYLNYRAELKKDGWSPYFGGGLGLLVAKGKANRVWTGMGYENISDTDAAFSLQVFLGAKYNLAEAGALQLGVRYMWYDALSFEHNNTTLVRTRSGDDLLLEVGYSFRF